MERKKHVGYLWRVSMAKQSPEKVVFSRSEIFKIGRPKNPTSTSSSVIKTKPCCAARNSTNHRPHQITLPSQLQLIQRLFAHDCQGHVLAMAAMARATRRRATNSGPRSQIGSSTDWLYMVIHSQTDWLYTHTPSNWLVIHPQTDSLFPPEMSAEFPQISSEV